ncbi:hypothetical protein [Arundinibacter roseus]|uniref:hypothetical protein n=1 Tax=Arundinibacter roseus TaxID=2070510 RepID=UPI0014050E17|nr:hypothetical protein [Arundinibacter roseus]
MLTHNDITLTETFSKWLSGDGKELRGFIQKGQQRGEVCVSVITQSSKSTVAQA